MRLPPFPEPQSASRAPRRIPWSLGWYHAVTSGTEHLRDTPILSVSVLSAFSQIAGSWFFLSSVLPARSAFSSPCWLTTALLLGLLVRVPLLLPATSSLAGLVNSYLIVSTQLFCHDSPEPPSSSPRRSSSLGMTPALGSRILGSTRLAGVFRFVSTLFFLLGYE